MQHIIVPYNRNVFRKIDHKENYFILFQNENQSSIGKTMLILIFLVAFKFILYIISTNIEMIKFHSELLAFVVRTDFVEEIEKDGNISKVTNNKTSEDLDRIVSLKKATKQLLDSKNGIWQDTTPIKNKMLLYQKGQHTDFFLEHNDQIYAILKIVIVLINLFIDMLIFFNMYSIYRKYIKFLGKQIMKDDVLKENIHNTKSAFNTIMQVLLVCSCWFLRALLFYRNETTVIVINVIYLLLFTLVSAISIKNSLSEQKFLIGKIKNHNLYEHIIFSCYSFVLGLCITATVWANVYHHMYIADKYIYYMFRVLHIFIVAMYVYALYGSYRIFSKVIESQELKI